MTQAAAANDNERVTSWKCIGAFLGLSEKSARQLERHAKHPLTVKVDTIGRVYKCRGDLARWAQEHEELLTREREERRAIG